MSTPSAAASTKGASLQATALNLSLTVKDVEASAAWYGVLGFTVDSRMEREGKLVSVAISSGAVHMRLNRDDGARGWDRVKGEGFSFQLATSQNIDDVAAGIKARGGKLESEPADMPWGARIFRMKDPDGYRFVVSKTL